jgi:hypothetical protein
MCKLPGIDQILAELIRAGCGTLWSEIHKVINSGIEKNCLLSGKFPLLYHITRRAIKVTVGIVMGHHCYQLHTEFYPVSFSQNEVHI